MEVGFWAADPNTNTNTNNNNNTNLEWRSASGPCQYRMVGAGRIDVSSEGFISFGYQMPSNAGKFMGQCLEQPVIQQSSAKEQTDLEQLSERLFESRVTNDDSKQHSRRKPKQKQRSQRNRVVMTCSGRSVATSAESSLPSAVDIDIDSIDVPVTSKPWVCAACTFSNENPVAPVCAVCQTRRG